jgi:hypothetical protein
MPLFPFAILFVLLGSANIQFDMTIRGVSSVALIGLSLFFDFGYFRIYEGFLHRYPDSFFAGKDRMQIDLLDKIRPDFRAHFVPCVLYVTLSTLVMLIAVYH